MAGKHAGLSRDELAAHMDRNPATITRWYRDEGQGPSRVHLEKWANVTGVSLTWLMTGESPSPDGDGLSSDEIAAFRELVRRQGLEPRTRWLSVLPDAA